MSAVHLVSVSCWCQVAFATIAQRMKIEAVQGSLIAAEVMSVLYHSREPVKLLDPLLFCGRTPARIPRTRCPSRGSSATYHIPSDPPSLTLFKAAVRVFRNNTQAHAILCRRLADPVTVCRKARRGSIRVLQRGLRCRTGGGREAALHRVREAACAPPGPRLALQAPPGTAGSRQAAPRIQPRPGPPGQVPVVRNGRPALPDYEIQSTHASAARTGGQGCSSEIWDDIL